MTIDGCNEWRGSDMLQREIIRLPLFLCCGGPSLNLVDKNLIKGPGRIVMCVNKTYPYIQPDIWIGMDEPENYNSFLLEEPFPKIFRGGYQNHKYFGKDLCRYYNTHFMCFANKENESKIGAAKDKRFWWHKNTFYSAIDVALWMGFKRIFLFGVDLDNSQKHYFDGTILTKEQEASNKKLYDGQFSWFDYIIKKCKENKAEIFSCSPGSRINTLIPYYDPYAVVKGIFDQLPKAEPKRHVLDK
jgi:hypothetical protein